MEGISDLKVVGIDETRPPMIRKEPYIELYFKLSHEAPIDWLRLFNDHVSKDKLPIKIKPAKSNIIETWVRSIDEVEPAFEKIKAAVSACIEIYINKILAQQNSDQSKATNGSLSPEQIQLNAVIARLKFDV